MAVWKGLHCLSVHLCSRMGLSWISEPAETLSPMIHVNQLNVLLHARSKVLKFPGSAQIFVSWYTWISVDTTGSSHTAIVSGRQGLALWLWSTCSFKLLFYIFGCTNPGWERAAWSMAADRQQCNWEGALLLHCPPLRFPVVSESNNSERWPQGQRLC